MHYVEWYETIQCFTCSSLVLSNIHCSDKNLILHPSGNDVVFPDVQCDETVQLLLWYCLSECFSQARSYREQVQFRKLVSHGLHSRGSPFAKLLLRLLNDITIHNRWNCPLPKGIQRKLNHNKSAGAINCLRCNLHSPENYLKVFLKHLTVLVVDLSKLKDRAIECVLDLAMTSFSHLLHLSSKPDQSNLRAYYYRTVSWVHGMSLWLEKQCMVLLPSPKNEGSYDSASESYLGNVVSFGFFRAYVDYLCTMSLSDYEAYLRNYQCHPYTSLLLKWFSVPTSSFSCPPSSTATNSASNSTFHNALLYCAHTLILQWTSHLLDENDGVKIASTTPITSVTAPSPSLLLRQVHCALFPNPSDHTCIASLTTQRMPTPNSLAATGKLLPVSKEASLPRLLLLTRILLGILMGPLSVHHDIVSDTMHAIATVLTILRKAAIETDPEQHQPHLQWKPYLPVLECTLALLEVFGDELSMHTETHHHHALTIPPAKASMLLTNHPILPVLLFGDLRTHFRAPVNGNHSVPTTPTTTPSTTSSAETRTNAIVSGTESLFNLPPLLPFLHPLVCRCGDCAHTSSNTTSKATPHTASHPLPSACLRTWALALQRPPHLFRSVLESHWSNERTQSRSARSPASLLVQERKDDTRVDEGTDMDTDSNVDSDSDSDSDSSTQSSHAYSSILPNVHTVRPLPPVSTPACLPPELLSLVLSFLPLQCTANAIGPGNGNGRGSGNGNRSDSAPKTKHNDQGSKTTTKKKTEITPAALRKAHAHAISQLLQLSLVNRNWRAGVMRAEAWKTLFFDRWTSLPHADVQKESVSSARKNKSKGIVGIPRATEPQEPSTPQKRPRMQSPKLRTTTKGSSGPKGNSIFRPSKTYRHSVTLIRGMLSGTMSSHGSGVPLDGIAHANGLSRKAQGLQAGYIRCLCPPRRATYITDIDHGAYRPGNSFEHRYQDESTACSTTPGTTTSTSPGASIRTHHHPWYQELPSHDYCTLYRLRARAQAETLERCKVALAARLQSAKSKGTNGRPLLYDYWTTGRIERKPPGPCALPQWLPRVCDVCVCACVLPDAKALRTHLREHHGLS